MTLFRYVSVGCGNLEATNIFVKRGAAFNEAKKCDVTPLMVAAQSDNL